MPSSLFVRIATQLTLVTHRLNPNGQFPTFIVS